MEIMKKSKKQKTKDDDFTKYLKRTSKIVKRWPKWKQEALG